MSTKTGDSASASRVPRGLPTYVPRSCDALTHRRWATLEVLTGWTVRGAKDLWKQRAVVSFSIGEQHQSVWIGETKPGVEQQGLNERGISLTESQGNHEFSARVYHGGFPEAIGLATSEAVPFIGLQGGGVEALRTLMMHRVGVLAAEQRDTLHRVVMHTDEAGSGAERSALCEVLGGGDEAGTINIAVPVGGAACFSELTLAPLAARVSSGVGTVDLAEGKVALAGLGLQRALGGGTG